MEPSKTRALSRVASVIVWVTVAVLSFVVYAQNRQIDELRRLAWENHDEIGLLKAEASRMYERMDALHFMVKTFAEDSGPRPVMAVPPLYSEPLKVEIVPQRQVIGGGIVP